MLYKGEFNFMLFRKMLKGIANIVTPNELETRFKKWELKNKLLRFSEISIGKNVCISSGFQCILGNEKNILINDYTAIGHNVKLYNFGSINIGAFTMIAAEVTMTNGGHDLSTFEPFSGTINIGRGCWIGHGAKIIRPVTIGDNVIIAAGAVVTRDIPPGAIAVGIPAKITKFRDFSNKVWCIGKHYFNPITFELIEENNK
jgi:acetyltransferase-like isoleucine patch superfamily enzyme